MEYVIAFDVSMGKSTMVVYDHNHTCHYEGELVHTQAGFQALQKRIEALHEKTGDLPAIVFEATGVYSQALERFLQENGYPYSRLNPLEAKLQTAAMRRQKTDMGDAHELAKFHFRVERQDTYIQGNYYRQLRALGRYCEDLEKEISQNHNRLHAFLQLSFPLLEKVFSKSSALFLNLVQLFPHPAYLDEVSEETLREQIQSATRKRLSAAEMEKKATLLLAAAKNTYPSIGPEDVRCQHLKNYAIRLLELRIQKIEVIQQMVTLSEGQVEFQVLKSFPGIGEQTAVQIIAELGDIHRFQNAKQINAFIGIDIRRHQSGKLHYQDKINKRGNKRLRTILYFMVKTMISLRRKTNNTIVDHYDQLKKQPNGKPHQVAVIACVNKFVKVAFHLIRHGLLYHYESGKAS